MNWNVYFMQIDAWKPIAAESFFIFVIRLVIARICRDSLPMFELNRVLIDLQETFFFYVCFFVCRYIKLSSPKLNNIAIIGTLLVYGAVVLLGVDHATSVSESVFPFVCVVNSRFTKLDAYHRHGFLFKITSNTYWICRYHFHNLGASNKSWMLSSSNSFEIITAWLESIDAKFRVALSEIAT